LFINADREYREGKAQNHLRPEDIDKIVHVYRAGRDVRAYARRVPYAELVAEDYNCNIRRYVDNAPPPEPHDVRAHLHGGVPVAEINALEHFWANYAGLRDSCFVPRADGVYADFSPALADKRAIATHVAAHPGVQRCQADFMAQLQAWWQSHLPVIDALAPDADNQRGTRRNVYALRATLLEGVERTFGGQNLLTRYQVRGAFANYFKQLSSDFKSIAASGWGAELIPNEDILQSQFPQVLAELEQQHARLAELQALFAAAGEEDFEDSEGTGVLPPEQVKELKTQLKEAKGQMKLAKRDTSFGDWKAHQAEAQRLEALLAQHKKLEDEAKALKAQIKGTEKNRDELVERARQKISPAEARQVILRRLEAVLMESYRQYLRADQRACVAALENLWGKYAVTAKQLEAARASAMAELTSYLAELGYE
jgi:type I restriction enzyme M protein